MPRGSSSKFVVNFIAVFLLADLGVSQDNRAAPATPNQTQEAQSQARGQGQQSDRRDRRGGRRRSRDDRQARTRRSQRVRMEQIEVVSPDGVVQLLLAPNAERLTYTVKMGDTTVIESSALRLVVDGYDLPSGVVLGSIETYDIDESYPWHGAHSTAVKK